MLNHNLYLQCDIKGGSKCNSNVTVIGNIISNDASGSQFRSGGTITNNALIRDPYGYNIGQPWSGVQTLVNNNVHIEQIDNTVNGGTSVSYDTINTFSSYKGNSYNLGTATYSGNIIVHSSTPNTNGGGISINSGQVGSVLENNIACNWKRNSSAPSGVLIWNQSSSQHAHRQLPGCCGLQPQQLSVPRPHRWHLRYVTRHRVVRRQYGWDDGELHLQGAPTERGKLEQCAHRCRLQHLHSSWIWRWQCEPSRRYRCSVSPHKPSAKFALTWHHISGDRAVSGGFCGPPLAALKCQNERLLGVRKPRCLHRSAIIFMKYRLKSAAAVHDYSMPRNPCIAEVFFMVRLNGASICAE